jgi:crotonobetainyl-CoA:carnitine CoA-transferase CaiB-like acyl-CoA transferase
VLDTQELIDEPSFYERGILQQMTHGERTMVMPSWSVRFDGAPTKVEPAPLLGEHIPQVLSDWLGLDAAAVADDAESIAIMNINELKKANDL